MLRNFSCGHQVSAGTRRSLSRRKELPIVILGLCFLLFAPNPSAQAVDLLIKGGHVIDPRNGVDAVLDVAIVEGKIAKVATNISPAGAKQVLDAKGLLVTPGLVDIHAHVFYGMEGGSSYSGGYNAVPPDPFTFRSGVTTIVDAGGSGWRDFERFKDQVIDRAETRVLAFLNIVGAGMKGGAAEQNLADMDPERTAARVRQFPEIIVGVKVAHYAGPEWDPIDRAVAAGHLAGVPVMVDLGGHTPPLSLKDLFTVHMRPGDLFTHTYAQCATRIAVVDKVATLRPYVLEARQRGVLFDVGHGNGSFLFRQAVPALKQGFPPDTISTDLHRGSMNSAMVDMLNIMSKFLAMGMSREDVVSCSTWNAARAIGRSDLGDLSAGASADVAVLRLRQGKFGFIDISNSRIPGDQRLECELTIRTGKVVWDLNGIASRPFNEVRAN